MAKKKLEDASPEKPEPEEAPEPTPKEQPEPKPAAKPKRARGKKPAKEEPKTAAKRPKAPLKENEVHVYSLDGEVAGKVELPAVFGAPLRLDLIRRAVTAFQANRRQPYGPNRKAGMRHSVRWSGKGHGVSRVPRIRGTMIGAQAPGTRGGRKGHGPKPWADWSKKINAKERVKARNSAIAALHQAELVSRRGHRFEAGRTLPIVVENGLEELDVNDLEHATKRGVEILRALGVYADVERAIRGTHIRAGRGKMRGRRYRTPRSVLLVAAKLDGIERCFRNLAGVEVVSPALLDAEILAPGGDPGRLAIFTERALEALRGWRP